MTTDETAGQALLNQRQKNAATAALSERGPTAAAEDRQPVLPPPLRRALDHPSNLLHECTQSATHQRATADMGQTGGIRWDYHPRCPLLFWCPSLTNSPLPSPSSPFLSQLLTRLSISGTATESQWQAETRKSPLSSPLSQPHANTHSTKLNQTRKDKHPLCKIMEDIMRFEIWTSTISWQLIHNHKWWGCGDMF